MQNFNILTNLCNWADWTDYYQVWPFDSVNASSTYSHFSVFLRYHHLKIIMSSLSHAFSLSPHFLLYHHAFLKSARDIENTRWVSFDIKFTRQGFENTCWHHNACRFNQHAFPKLSLENLLSKDVNLVFYLSAYQVDSLFILANMT